MVEGIVWMRRVDGVTETATHGPDGELVEFSVALAAWSSVARATLEKAAKEYGSFVTYKELGEIVQDETGIKTTKLLHNWIGRLLRGVSDVQDGTGEPLLTSLVVRADQTIGAGFSDVIRSRDGADPEDIELVAAEERLACYRHFGASVPEGAQPKLTPEVAAARSAARLAEKMALPAKVCPSCYIQLPATGVCDSCET